ncbi:5271_t:CDS:2 [Acaulospora colombiana]|uniref:5271_t:CDS:1 n=1 Tax=Acaulospora colombiana TaxID=27376 RepID=A0ACA9LQY4_9GLOM|nr:5271_t:CDS:2 [Acaulospora colombiana]
MSMFDTATAFSYHSSPTNSQDAKGLFGNLKIPSSLPTQLISSSLVMLPLGGYFSQKSSPQEPEGTLNQQNVPSSTFNLTSHSAPQQPTHSNKRSSRKTVQQQPQQQQKRQSFSSAIASTLTVGSMASKKHSSAIVDGAHHQRRKRSSNKINRKKIDQAIAFSAYAVEEDHQENPDCALDLYFTALEQMLEALPIHADQSRRDALKNKLKEFMDRAGLTEEMMESSISSSPSPDSNRDAKKCECNSSARSPQSHDIKDSRISQHIINAAITSAVALKQSPIPDAVSATVNYTMRKIKNIDEAYGLQDKAWEISRTGINLALEIDQQYNVHQKVSNVLFTGLAAAMKAGIAYKDSPSYRELKKRCQYPTAVSSENSITCSKTEECITC